MSQRPTQAVIFAGGRGVRLGRLTDDKPKPMIEFHGKPFLEYLIEMLRDQGFDRVLLLLGYLPEVIQKHFGDGSRWKLHIDYALSPVTDETGRRLRLAERRLDPVFLLMYCDNYWPMPFDRMWGRFLEFNASALVTVFQDASGERRRNMAVDADDRVIAYDKSRTLSGLNANDIGFMIIKREALNWLPEGNPSFEQSVFPPLIAHRELLAWPTRHRYYSVGSEDRLADTAEFLRRTPTVLVDRDGVLNKRMPRAEYVCDVADWEWLPGSREALRCLHEAGFRVMVITNQPGIARGALTEQTLGEIHEHMKTETRHAGGEITAVYHCPHGWDDGCVCRKPQPGMLLQAQEDFHLDLSRVYFIGDDERDQQAAEAAGCKPARVADGIEFLTFAKRLVAGELP
jgi:D-glycero-D-manno-heptose 1,7-bisphosphate phosphatase